MRAGAISRRDAVAGGNQIRGGSAGAGGRTAVAGGANVNLRGNSIDVDARNEVRCERNERDVLAVRADHRIVACAVAGGEAVGSHGNQLRDVRGGGELARRGGGGAERAPIDLRDARRNGDAGCEVRRGGGERAEARHGGRGGNGRLGTGAVGGIAVGVAADHDGCGSAGRGGGRSLQAVVAEINIRRLILIGENEVVRERRKGDPRTGAAGGWTDVVNVQRRSGIGAIDKTIANSKLRLCGVRGKIEKDGKAEKRLRADGERKRVGNAATGRVVYDFHVLHAADEQLIGSERRGSRGGVGHACHHGDAIHDDVGVAGNEACSRDGDSGGNRAGHSADRINLGNNGNCEIHSERHSVRSTATGLRIQHGDLFRAGLSDVACGQGRGQLAGVHVGRGAVRAVHYDCGFRNEILPEDRDGGAAARGNYGSGRNGGDRRSGTLNGVDREDDVGLSGRRRSAAAG